MSTARIPDGTPCPYRDTCRAHTELSCRENMRPIMRQAVSQCRVAECFVIFGRLRGEVEG